MRSDAFKALHSKLVRSQQWHKHSYARLGLMKQSRMCDSEVCGVHIAQRRGLCHA